MNNDVNIENNINNESTCSVPEKYIELVKNKPYRKLVRNTKIKYYILIVFQLMFVISSIKLVISVTGSDTFGNASGMSPDAKAFYTLITLGFFAIFIAIEEFITTMAIPYMIFTIVLLIVFILRKNYKLMCYEDAFIEVYGEEKLKDKVFLNNQVVTDE